MDPNILQATLHSCTAASTKRNRGSHLEGEMVVYKLAEDRPNQSWSGAVQHWLGTELILLGKRLTATTPLERPGYLTDQTSIH